VRTDRAIGEDIARVYDLFPRLRERRHQTAGTMSGGEQQMLAIGRALMAQPKLLIMDEPSMGLSPIFVERVFDTITTINKQGTTIFMVEQNAFMALSIANRGYVLRSGHIMLEGPSKELLESDSVRREYLGGV
jgi:branched-chain amino acid transport system ATP-binding protein